MKKIIIKILKIFIFLYDLFLEEYIFLHIYKYIQQKLRNKSIKEFLYFLKSINNKNNIKR